MKHRKQSQARKASPKHNLSLPDLDQARSAVLNSLPSKESQRGYRHAIDEFITCYCSEPRLSFNKAVVTRYRITWNRVNLRRARLTAGSLPSGASHTKLLTQDFAPGLRISLRRMSGRKLVGVTLAAACQNPDRLSQPIAAMRGTWASKCWRAMSGENSGATPRNRQMFWNTSIGCSLKSSWNPIHTFRPKRSRYRPSCSE